MDDPEALAERHVMWFSIIVLLLSIVAYSNCHYWNNVLGDHSCGCKNNDHDQWDEIYADPYEYD
jgi:hypothetical protein